MDSKDSRGSIDPQPLVKVSHEIGIGEVLCRQDIALAEGTGDEVIGLGSAVEVMTEGEDEVLVIGFEVHYFESGIVGIWDDGG